MKEWFMKQLESNRGKTVLLLIVAALCLLVFLAPRAVEAAELKEAGNSVLFSCVDGDEPDIARAEVRATNGTDNFVVQYAGGCPSTPTIAPGSDSWPAGDYAAEAFVIDTSDNESGPSNTVNFTLATPGTMGPPSAPGALEAQ